jgi:hypothetical protein
MRCGSCGHEWQGGFGEACPACGTVAQNPFTENAAPPPPPAPPTGGPSPWQSPRVSPSNVDGGPELGDGIPWESEQSAQSLFETLKAVLLETQQTFGRASKTQSIGPAFIYVLILGVAGGLIGQLWSLATTGFMSNLAGIEGMEGMEGIGGLATSGVTGFLLVPVWVVGGCFVVAGLVHLTLMMLGAASAGFEATFRVIAFAQGSAAPLQIVPVLGPLIGMVWGIVVEIMGIKELHDTTTGKAAAAVLLPLFVCCCCVIAGIASMAGAIASATQGL